MRNARFGNGCYDTVMKFFDRQFKNEEAARIEEIANVNLTAIKNVYLRK